jgi:hypothetical protein
METSNLNIGDRYYVLTKSERAVKIERLPLKSIELFSCKDEAGNPNVCYQFTFDDGAVSPEQIFEKYEEAARVAKRLLKESA